MKEGPKKTINLTSTFVLSLTSIHPYAIGIRGYSSGIRSYILGSGAIPVGSGATPVGSGVTPGGAEAIPVGSGGYTGEGLHEGDQEQHLQ
jgi:hypothetical protein